MDTLGSQDIKTSTSIAEQKIEELHCKCPTFPLEEYAFCPIHRSDRPDSVLGELLWKYELKTCEKCKSNSNNNFSNITKWNNVNNWSTTFRSEWDSENLRNNLRNIWNGGEVRQFIYNIFLLSTKNKFLLIL